MTANGRDQTEQRPPWADVDPRAVVAQLTTHVAALMQQLAMRDAYIDQLHQALQLTASAVPQEEPA